MEPAVTFGFSVSWVTSAIMCEARLVPALSLSLVIAEIGEGCSKSSSKTMAFMTNLRKIKAPTGFYEELTEGCSRMSFKVAASTPGFSEHLD